VRRIARTILDWFMLAVCAVLIVLAAVRPIDPARRTLVIVASAFIGARRAIALFNRTAS